MSDVEHLFMCFFSHLCVFFGEISVLIFGPFFDWVIYFSGIELKELRAPVENRDLGPQVMAALLLNPHPTCTALLHYLKLTF